MKGDWMGKIRSAAPGAQAEGHLAFVAAASPGRQVKTGLFVGRGWTPINGFCRQEEP